MGEGELKTECISVWVSCIIQNLAGLGVFVCCCGCSEYVVVDEGVWKSVWVMICG